jgi:hypothetical protein
MLQPVILKMKKKMLRDRSGDGNNTWNMVRGFID